MSEAVCAACKESRPKSEYSASQLKLKGKRRCNLCVSRPFETKTTASIPFAENDEVKLLEYISSSCTLIEAVQFYGRSHDCNCACLAVLSNTGLARDVSDQDCKAFFEIMRGGAVKSKSTLKSRSNLKGLEKQEMDELIDYWKSDNFAVMLQITNETQFVSVRKEFCKLLGEALQEQQVLEEVGQMPGVYDTLLRLLADPSEPELQLLASETLLQASQHPASLSLLLDRKVARVLTLNLRMDKVSSAAVTGAVQVLGMGLVLNDQWLPALAREPGLVLWLLPVLRFAKDAFARLSAAMCLVRLLPLCRAGSGSMPTLTGVGPEVLAFIESHDSQVTQLGSDLSLPACDLHTLVTMLREASAVTNPAPVVSPLPSALPPRAPGGFSFGFALASSEVSAEAGATPVSSIPRSEKRWIAAVQSVVLFLLRNQLSASPREVQALRASVENLGADPDPSVAHQATRLLAEMAIAREDRIRRQDDASDASDDESEEDGDVPQFPAIREEEVCFAPVLTFMWCSHVCIRVVCERERVVCLFVCLFFFKKKLI
jgi:hypothetical protein